MAKGVKCLYCEDSRLESLPHTVYLDWSYPRFSFPWGDCR